MEDTSSISQAVQALAKAASARAPFGFICTILRVQGIDFRTGWDEFEEPETLSARVEASFKDRVGATFEREALLRAYSEILSTREVNNVLTNLARVALGMGYSVGPLDDAGESLPVLLERAGQNRLAQIIEVSWDDRLVQPIRAGNFSIENEEVVVAGESWQWPELRPKLEVVLDLYAALGIVLRSARLSFRNQTLVHPMGRYSEELHLLVDESVGLYGFEIRRPSNPSSRFTRTRKGTEAVNIGFAPDGTLSFFVSDLDEFRKHPTLLSVLRPGTMKYNEDGQWKPLVYPADTSAIQQEALKATNDERAQGVLFYIRLTGHRTIEFAVKCGIWLDEQHTVLPNGVHLYRVTRADELRASNDNLVVYDGWFVLQDDSVEMIQSGLEEIARTMNVLAFVFEQEVTWRTKYTIIDHARGRGQPNEEDLGLLRAILQEDVTSEARRILDAALDWYARGERSNSVFNRFLCFWIAMEGLAVSLYDGKLGDPSPFALPTETDADRSKRMRKCIEEYLEGFHQTGDPRVVERAYFDCVRSLRYKTRESLGAVFGDEQVLDAVFRKHDGISTEDVRHKIAHGELVEWDFGHESLVRSRVGVVQEIGREFILRVLTRTPPGEEVKGWSRLFRLGLVTADPRSTLVISDERFLPAKDWTIRGAWIE